MSVKEGPNAGLLKSTQRTDGKWFPLHFGPKKTGLEDWTVSGMELDGGEQKLVPAVQYCTVLQGGALEVVETRQCCNGRVSQEFWTKDGSSLEAFRGGWRCRWGMLCSKEWCGGWTGAVSGGA